MIKKENILESARKVLSEQGIEKLSLRKIAAETGCAAPSIYYYYKNKQEIVAALWEQIGPTLVAQLNDAGLKGDVYRDFWLAKPDDFRLFITNADYFPLVAKSESYQQISAQLAQDLHKLNGELMASIYLSMSKS